MLKKAFSILLISTIALLLAGAKAAVDELPEKDRLSAAGGDLNTVQSPVIFVIAAIVVVLLILVSALLVLHIRKLHKAQRQIQGLNSMMKTFFNADESMVFLKDPELKYVFVNKAAEAFYKTDASIITGRTDTDFFEKKFAELCSAIDYQVLEDLKPHIDEIKWRGRLLKYTRFPVELTDGRYGVGAYVKDITLQHVRERIKEKNLQRNSILVNVFRKDFKSTQEQLDYVLGEALKMTESTFGYIYMYDEDKEEFKINSWSKDVMSACAVNDYQTVYQLKNTGIWGEVVRQRKPVIVNNYAKPHLLKKGLPEGHVKLKRFMSVPVMIDKKIVAVIGLANKEQDYDKNDVYQTMVLMNGVWNAVERREALDRFTVEKNKYLQTLMSIGDGVIVVDSDGRVEMLNKIAENMTGYTAAQAAGQPYQQILLLSHENKNRQIKDPVAEVFRTGAVSRYGNHKVLTSKNGAHYNTEDKAAPIKDENGQVTGVVLVIRDVTEKKQQRKEIEHLSFHDHLTGLYNRRFFEEELSRLDNQRNLPISIIMGDVNGLKLTNDIFGHSYGDMLLTKVAKVIKDACRANDIIARWGGDEFIILLPKTSPQETELIIDRIKEQFAQEKIHGIRGSISMGYSTKVSVEAELIQTVNSAEEKMYLAKTLERDSIRSGTLDAIIQMLHKDNDRERQHSMRVGMLCQNLGLALGLSEVKVRKLKELGYLHDIGKIVLDKKLLNKGLDLTAEELADVKKHVVVGYRILNAFDDTMDIAEAVLAHHERWDGSGYPKGLKGHEAPLLARIIALVGSFDRMTHESENTKALTQKQAIKKLRKNAGVLYDPQLTEAFINMIEEEHN